MLTLLFLLLNSWNVKNFLGIEALFLAPGPVALSTKLAGCAFDVYMYCVFNLVFFVELAVPV